MPFDIRSPSGVFNYAASGDFPWADLDSLSISDNLYTSIPLDVSNDESSYFLMVDDFQFNIPSTGIIGGITVFVENFQNQSDIIHEVGSLKKGVSGLTIINENKVLLWPTGEAIQQVGGSADLWNEIWTPSVINSSGFGFAIRVSAPSGSAGLIGNIDHVQIQVDYSHQTINSVSGDFTLFMCGHVNDVKHHQYGPPLFNNEFSTIKFSNTVNFDYGYWKMNEGSGNILYPVDVGPSGNWEQAHSGEPHWFQGMQSNSEINKFHVTYEAFGVGLDLDDSYERAVKIGTGVAGGDVARTFKYNVSAPTGDFTIFMALTHSGDIRGNLLGHFNSGNLLTFGDVDFLLKGGNGIYEFTVQDKNNGAITNSIITNLIHKPQSSFHPVRPIIVATYGGPAKEVAMYIGHVDYNRISTIASGSKVFSTPNGRLVVNSGAMFLPGIEGAFGAQNNPAYYEEFGIANTHLTSGQAIDLIHSYNRGPLSFSVAPDVEPILEEIMSTRQSKPHAGFNTTGKGFLQFDVPNYSGYVFDGFDFFVRDYDQTKLFHLKNDANSLKINAFISNTTNNPSGVEVIFGNDNIDWSGHPIILPSGEHFIEVTGSFPNDKFTFNTITGLNLISDNPYNITLTQIDQGNDLYYADTKIYGIEVVYSGEYKPDSINTNHTLYTFGAFLENSGIDLFTKGIVTNSGDFTLFTGGKVTNSDTITLFTLAGFAQTQLPNMTLYMSGHPVSNTHTLYVRGITKDTQTMNLYVKGTPPANSSGNFPLYMTATSGLTSGFDSIPLYVQSFNNPFPNGGMNMFLSVLQTETIALTKTMNLFMKGLGDESGFQKSSANINMFINNDAIADNSGISLFINQQTASNASGYVPVSGFMNLFINRQFESVAHNLPMFINGPSGFNDNITLFMQALPNNRSGISMYIDGIGTFNKPVNLYNHGF